MRGPRPSDRPPPPPPPPFTPPTPPPPPTTYFPTQILPQQINAVDCRNPRGEWPYSNITSATINPFTVHLYIRVYSNTSFQ